MRLQSEVKSILVLYTGGTIGMTKNVDGVYSPSLSNTFVQKIKEFPEMHDQDLARKICEGNVPNDLCAIPHVAKHIETITYSIKEYDPLLDSSNMSVEDWKCIAKDIEENYYDYDGFVVLHGTDTMAYTASALSFMLEGLGKTVVVTGSQIPIFEKCSDAKENILKSLVFAACYHIPEVCICFASRLFRGNRTVKSSSNRLKAFTSPNYHNLGKVGIDFDIHKDYVLKMDKCVPFKVHTNLNPNVITLTLFPTMTANMCETLIQCSNPPIKGLILQCYGIGNIPNKEDFVHVLKKAIDDGIIIVNVTQCAQGTVNFSYETGKTLETIGVIPGYDMTVEAALTKLAFVLGFEDLPLDRKKEMMMTNIRGELTRKNI